MARKKEDYVDTDDLNQTYRIMHWLSLSMAVVALVIATLAYAAADAQFPEEWNLTQATQETAAKSEQEVAELSAMVRLQALKLRLLAQESIDDADEQIAAISNDLERAYDGADEEAAAELEQMQDDLEVLADQLRNDTAAALDTIQGLMEQLENTVDPNT